MAIRMGCVFGRSCLWHGILDGTIRPSNLQANKRRSRVAEATEDSDSISMRPCHGGGWTIGHICSSTAPSPRPSASTVGRADFSSRYPPSPLYSVSWYVVGFGLWELPLHGGRRTTIGRAPPRAESPAKSWESCHSRLLRTAPPHWLFWPPLMRRMASATQKKQHKIDTQEYQSSYTVYLLAVLVMHLS